MRPTKKQKQQAAKQTVDNPENERTDDEPIVANGL